MLDQLDATDQLTLLSQCRDSVDLSEAGALTSQSGFAPSREGERRRFPRMRTNLRAPMQVISTLPAVPRPSDWHEVRVIDLSKGGIGLLHSQQLYPKEQIRIMVQDGVLQVAEVVWCQRVADRCYRVGCSFSVSQAKP